MDHSLLEKSMRQTERCMARDSYLAQAIHQLQLTCCFQSSND